MFLDYNFSKLTLNITYDRDNSEISRVEYNYDTEGREVGVISFSNGIISSQSRNYVYIGKELVYYLDYYSNGKVSYTHKIKKVFF